MNNLQIVGLPRAEILKQITTAYPEWRRPENHVRQLVGPRTKREVQLEQGAAIAYLASQYNQPGARILEIGGCQGYSAGILKLAAPDAVVTTLEPHEGRASAIERAVGQLGVAVVQQRSGDFLADVSERETSYELIFVDGDHANVAHDLAFWNLIRPGGLFLHHDFSSEGSARECIPVYDALNHFGDQLDRAPDVLVQDDTEVGMAGWYREPWESWPPDGHECGENGYVVDQRQPAGQKPHEFSSAKGVICRHCLKTNDDGDHFATGGVVPPAVEVGDLLPDGDTVDLTVTSSSANVEEALVEEEETKPKPRRRTRRSGKASSSD